MAQTTKSLLHLTQDIKAFFEANQIDACPVIRLKDKEAGLRLINVVNKELELVIKLGPEIGYIDLHGIRFVWPMK